MNLSKQLDQIADLLEAGIKETSTVSKTASAVPVDDGVAAALTSLRMGIYMHSKKAGYLDLFKDLAEKGVLK